MLMLRVSARESARVNGRVRFSHLSRLYRLSARSLLRKKRLTCQSPNVHKTHNISTAHSRTQRTHAHSTPSRVAESAVLLSHVPLPLSDLANKSRRLNQRCKRDQHFHSQNQRETESLPKLRCRSAAEAARTTTSAFEDCFDVTTGHFASFKSCSSL